MSDWGKAAACAGQMYFTELPEAEQRATCVRCPVRFECLEDAVSSASRVSSRDLVPRAGLSALELGRLIRGRRADAQTFALVCAQCGASFSAKSRAALYCSSLCRARAYQARRPRSVAPVGIAS